MTRYTRGTEALRSHRHKKPCSFGCLPSKLPGSRIQERCKSLWCGGNTQVLAPAYRASHFHCHRLNQGRPSRPNRPNISHPPPWPNHSRQTLPGKFGNQNFPRVTTAKHRIDQNTFHNLGCLPQPQTFQLHMACIGVLQMRRSAQRRSLCSLYSRSLKSCPSCKQCKTRNPMRGLLHPVCSPRTPGLMRSSNRCRRRNLSSLYVLCLTSSPHRTRCSTRNWEASYGIRLGSPCRWWPW